MSSSRFSLFVPHGSPMFALDPGQAGAAMSQIATQYREPRAIVIISPHWLTERPAVSVSTQLETIHDFYGFDRALYDMQYPASGCPEAAQVVIQALAAAGLPVERAERGLDHGAWVPLMLMYPSADIPVLQLALQPRLGARHHFELGRALAPLRAVLPPDAVKVLEEQFRSACTVEIASRMACKRASIAAIRSTGVAGTSVGQEALSCSAALSVASRSASRPGRSVTLSRKRRSSGPGTR